MQFRADVRDARIRPLAQNMIGARVRVPVLLGLATEQLSRAIGQVILPVLRSEVPRKTGALADRMRVEVRSAGEAMMVGFYSDVPYAGFVAHGTGIYAGHSAWDVEGPQAFMVAGEMIYAMHTHHLGQRPNPFPQRALERSRPDVDTVLVMTARQLLREVLG